MNNPRVNLDPTITYKYTAGAGDENKIREVAIEITDDRGGMSDKVLGYVFNAVYVARVLSERHVPKKISIQVNGQVLEHGALNSLITYEELVEFAGKKGFPTVVWSMPQTNDGGILSPGQSVKMRPGMHFTVMHT